MCNNLLNMADSVLKHNLNLKSHWGYEYGLLLEGLLLAYDVSKDEKYLRFVADTIDSFVKNEHTAQSDDSTKQAETANVEKDHGPEHSLAHDSWSIIKIRGYDLEEYNIDHLNNGKVLLKLFNKKHDPCYLIAATRLFAQSLTHPRISDGVFWHKAIYPHQVWCDGLYMGVSFIARYVHNSISYLKRFADEKAELPKSWQDVKSLLNFYALEFIKGNYTKLSDIKEHLAKAKLNDDELSQYCKSLEEKLEPIIKKHDSAAKDNSAKANATHANAASAEAASAAAAHDDASNENAIAQDALPKALRKSHEPTLEDMQSLSLEEIRDLIFMDLVLQFVISYEHLIDEHTKLMYHGYDDKRLMFWADKDTGHSKCFWGRAMGWYVMALVDVIELIDETKPYRKVLATILNTLLAALIKVKSQQNLWYQVLNEKNRDGNYEEASASCMIDYALFKASRLNLIKRSAADNSINSADIMAQAKSTFAAINEHFVSKDANARLSLNKICEVAGLGGANNRSGTFEYYMSEPVVTNDAKGLGPYLLAAYESEL